MRFLQHSQALRQQAPCINPAMMLMWLCDYVLAADLRACLPAVLLLHVHSQVTACLSLSGR
jgi:hypothetical protein